MNKTILIANDDADMVTVIRNRLRKMNYDLIVARDGKEAIQLTRQYRPDVIVMDYHMPIFNGLEASQEIKRDTQLQSIPVLFLTASLNISGIQTANPKDFIEIVDLADRIKKLVDS